MDQHMFAFYAKNNALRITDLHQGIIWGIDTPEMMLDPRLIGRFDYDGDYGTVLNRFLMQAAVEHPLTVYGTGGQTRAFIHIQDSVACIALAVVSPPNAGEPVRIYNQMTECHRVRDLADLVANLTGSTIEYLDNPRKEAIENDLDVANFHLMDLGLKPTLLSDSLMMDVKKLAAYYTMRYDWTKIKPTSRW
jgi:UDP-sulfoquinovose synthase